MENCKKITYENGFINGLPNSTTILCRVISEDDEFLTVKTAKRTTRIAKRYIVSISDTNVPFKEESESNEEWRDVT